MLTNCYTCEPGKGQVQKIPVDHLILKDPKIDPNSKVSMKFQDNMSPNIYHGILMNNSIHHQQQSFPQSPHYYPKKNYQYPKAGVATDSRIQYGHWQNIEQNVSIKEPPRVLTESSVSYRTSIPQFIPHYRQFNPENRFFVKPVQKALRIKTEDDEQIFLNKVSTTSRISHQSELSCSSQIEIPNVVSTDSRIVYGPPISKIIQNRCPSNKFPRVSTEFNQKINHSSKNQLNKDLKSRRVEITRNYTETQHELIKKLHQENARLHAIINNEYMPLKVRYQRLVQEQDEREYLISMLQWKIKELAKELRI